MADSRNIAKLLRQALTEQIEVDLDEVVLPRRPLAINPARLGSLVLDPAEDSPVATIEASYSSMTEHRAAICECQKCALGATRTRFVYGVGNPHADLMFIGEAPGANEDLQGEPFVGRGGQLLDKILAAIGLSREKVYIANILKCRPPENRDPSPDEMALCFPYLEEQVRLVKPKLICALGRIAAQALLQTSTPLGRLRSEFHEYQGVPILVTFHPAALLRFPKYKHDTWADMQMLKAKLDELTGVNA